MFSDGNMIGLLIDILIQNKEKHVFLIILQLCYAISLYGDDGFILASIFGLKVSFFRSDAAI